jgi:hypothetical protein
LLWFHPEYFDSIGSNRAASEYFVKDNKRLKKYGNKAFQHFAQVDMHVLAE